MARRTPKPKRKRPDPGPGTDPLAEEMLQLDSTRWSGFRDGFGERENGVDQMGFSIELLRLRKEFSPFELPLSDRILRLIDVDRLTATRPLRVDHDEDSTRLILVSERAPGLRLSYLLTRSAERGVIADLGAALFVMRRLLSTAAAFHAQTGVSHFAIAPERIVITPRGEVVLVEAALAGAIEAFGHMPAALRKALRLAKSDADPERDGARLDTARIALIGMAMMVGRALDPAESIDPLSPIVQEVADVAALRAGDTFSALLTTWFDRAITIDAELSFADFREASVALERIIPPAEARSAASRQPLWKFCQDLALDESWQTETAALEDDRIRDIRARQARRGPQPSAPAFEATEGFSLETRELLEEFDQPIAAPSAPRPQLEPDPLLDLPIVEDLAAQIFEQPVETEDLAAQILEQPLVNEEPSAIDKALDAGPVVEEPVPAVDVEDAEEKPAWPSEFIRPSAASPVVEEPSITAEETQEATVEDQPTIEEPIVFDQPRAIDELDLPVENAHEDTVWRDLTSASSEPFASLTVDDPVTVEEPIVFEQPLTVEEPLAVEEPVASFVTAEDNQDAEEKATWLSKLTAALLPSSAVEDPPTAEEPIAFEQPLAIEEAEGPVEAEPTVEEPIVFDEPIAIQKPVTSVSEEDWTSASLASSVVEDPLTVEEPTAIQELVASVSEDVAEVPEPSETASEMPPPVDDEETRAWIRAAVEQITRTRDVPPPPAPGLPDPPPPPEPVFEFNEEPEPAPLPPEIEPPHTSMSELARDLGLLLDREAADKPADKPKWTAPPAPPAPPDEVVLPRSVSNDQMSQDELRAWETDIQGLRHEAAQPPPPPVPVPTRIVLESAPLPPKAPAPAPTQIVPESAPPPPPPGPVPAPKRIGLESASAPKPPLGPPPLPPPTRIVLENAPQQTRVKPTLAPAPRPEPAAVRAASSGGFLRKAAVLLVGAGLIAGGAVWARGYYARGKAPGTVVVQSTPPGAEILIDGAARGVTPLTLELPPGSHNLELRRRGLSRQFALNVQPGAQLTQTLDWSTVRAVGSLAVTSDPAGAKVLVDGKNVGVTPITIPDLPAGRRRVVIESSSGTVRREVMIESGATARLDEAIFSGWIAVFAPLEVQIYERKRLIGTSESGRIMVAPGRHELELVNTEVGFRETRGVDVAPGQTTAVNITEIPAAAASVPQE